MQPIGIFIDNSNLLNTLKEHSGNLQQGGKRIDYGRLCRVTIEELEKQKNFHGILTQVHLYDGIVENDKEKTQKKIQFIQSAFGRIKKECGKEIKTYYHLVPVHLGKDKHLKGDDLLIAMDVTLQLCKKTIAIAIIISGDGDFAPFIQRLTKEENKNVFSAFIITQGLSERISKAPFFISIPFEAILF